MVEFFEMVADFFANLWEFVDWLWNFLQYVISHFGLTLLVDLGLIAVSAALSFMSGVANLVGAQAFSDGMQTASDTLASETVDELWNICGYVLDYVVPVGFLNAVLGMMVIVWMYGFIVSHIFKIYHQFWGSS